MKLLVGDVVEISSAAGCYKAVVEKVTRGFASDFKEYDWYTTKTLQEVSSTGERLSRSGYFNENMADQLVKNVEAA